MRLLLSAVLLLLPGALGRSAVDCAKNQTFWSIDDFQLHSRDEVGPGVPQLHAERQPGQHHGGNQLHPSRRLPLQHREPHRRPLSPYRSAGPDRYALRVDLTESDLRQEQHNYVRHDLSRAARPFPPPADSNPVSVSRKAFNGYGELELDCVTVQFGRSDCTAVAMTINGTATDD